MIIAAFILFLFPADSIQTVIVQSSQQMFRTAVSLSSAADGTLFVVSATALDARSRIYKWFAKNADVLVYNIRPQAMARLRLTRVPQLLVGAATLSAVALILVMR